MRDAVSLLELCAGSREKIDASLVSSTVGTGNREIVYTLVKAIGNSDFSLVYKTVSDVVSGSADISVFWQEIIDTYRDIMVVKNSDSAKTYLDLTDAEFASITELAKSFSMAKLAYHATLLQAALADMQRSQNSKRSVAEIALTRMCDSKLLSTPEALTLRVEELEKQLSMIKMGAIPLSKGNDAPTNKIEADKTLEKKAEAPIAEKPMREPPSFEPSPFAKWSTVVDRISELKPPLAAGLRKALAFTLGEYSYLIKLDAFYKERLSKSVPEMALLRGAIAEKEGISPEAVRVRLEANTESGVNFANEIENALKF